MTFGLFLSGVLRHPAQFRAIAPSSRRLALAMQDSLEFRAGAWIVELGCGSGPFTQELDRLCHARRWNYLGIELDATLCTYLQHRFPTREFVCASAEALPNILRERGISQASAIVSGVPLAAMSGALQQRIVEAAACSLLPTGVFRHFTYWHYQRSSGARRLRELLAARFQNFEIHARVAWNLPPALVLSAARPH